MDRGPQRSKEAGRFDEDDTAADQEFERALSAGAEALQRGDAQTARQLLEESLRRKPGHQRARNLLGLSLFKLGDLAKAESIYRSLLEDHPADPTLRVNLGLVFLKSGSASDAVRCFETALDLSPDHKKAQNYLGIALSQKGELVRAREWFVKAGNAAMAQKMERDLAVSPLRDVAKNAEGALAATRPFKSALDPSEAGPANTETGTRWVATTAPEPAVVEPKRPVGAGGVAVPVDEPSVLANYTAERRLSMPAGESGFAIGPTEVVVQVRGEMLTRLDGLVASWGQLGLKPELKRFRGKATDKFFGEGGRRMLRASGAGRFIISREGRTFTALELGDEPAYFREEALFAFEESVVFENGRVPSRSGGYDLHLVHVRGRGKLLVVTAGTPKSVELGKGEPLRIPMDQLVGWHGPGIQPRIVPIVEQAPEMGVALELSGEGRAIVDAPDGR
ncbi:MAG: tetratricopeptide repeat protein [Myxococcales bacterium]